MMNNYIVRNLEKYFSNPALSVGERRKSIIFASCLLAMTPAIYLFVVINYIAGRYHESLTGFLLAGCMLILLLMIKSLPSTINPFRFIVIAALATLSYQLIIGGGSGHAFVWFYCLPMIVFYVFGLREGIFWVVVSIVLTTLLFLFSPAREFHSSIDSLRFLLTYAIVAIIAYGLESSRSLYARELMNERDALHLAMQQIKTLRGLLPICASCKSIRDDQGYWNRIENYLNDHSEAKLSHGICPDCLKRLYPEEFAEMTESGHFPQLEARRRS